MANPMACALASSPSPGVPVVPPRLRPRRLQRRVEQCRLLHLRHARCGAQRLRCFGGLGTGLGSCRQRQRESGLPIPLPLPLTCGSCSPSRRTCTTAAPSPLSRPLHLCASSSPSPDSASPSAPRKMEVAYDPKGSMERYAQAYDPERVQRGPASLTLFSPSKVNVFLRVTRKRPDEYHDLASLFHTISLGDVLKFSLSPSNKKDALTTTAPGVPLDDTNLVIKALNLFRKKTGIDTHFWIHLDKRVPTGAGLGGGSGNAATALWAANVMTGSTVAEGELQKWSAEIGSDIPFFFSHGAAFCTGRGEIVEDLSSQLSLQDPLVLMKPRDACSTAQVYKKFKLESASKEDPLRLLSAVLEKGISQSTCINDLEAPAFEVLPSLKKFKARVQAAGLNQFSAVFMSGSGSTIVGVGDYEAPSFIYDEEAYEDVFVSEASFIKRCPGEWYHATGAFEREGPCGPSSAREGGVEDGSASRGQADVGGVPGVGKVAMGMDRVDKLKLPFSYEA